MTKTILKNLVVRKIGNSYGILIPKTLVENTNLIKLNELCDLIISYKMGTLFSKLRKIIGKDQPDFLDRNQFSSGYIKYRIGWHSCRRWFETRIWEQYKDKMLLRDVMRYRDSKTVDVYIDPYEIWKNELNILNTTFGALYSDFNTIARGQMKLNTFFER